MILISATVGPDGVVQVNTHPSGAAAGGYEAMEIDSSGAAKMTPTKRGRGGRIGRPLGSKTKNKSTPYQK